MESKYTSQTRYYFKANLVLEFMAKIHLEEKNGIPYRFVKGQDGIRLYLLPHVPMDAGEIESEKSFNLEEAVSSFPEELQGRVKTIGERYKGRQMDAVGVLLYAHEQERFDEYAKRLEAKPRDFNYIHPDLMMARNDVTAFFLRLYADLGIAPKKEAESSERQVKNYGIGVVVFPKEEIK